VTATSIPTATTADATAIATVHVEGWLAAYDGLVPASMFAGLSVADRAARWAQALETDRGVLVADVDDSIVGFASVGSSRDDDAVDGDGELYAIYLDPAQWSTGIGHALHEAAMETLAAVGYTRASLWVLEGNARAIRFYERHGWSADGAIKDDVRDDAVLREARMRRDVLAVDG
jgi:ribosomal protein S18 acetylase RimI-like enzyme